MRFFVPLMYTNIQSTGHLITNNLYVKNELFSVQLKNDVLPKNSKLKKGT